MWRLSTAAPWFQKSQSTRRLFATVTIQKIELLSQLIRRFLMVRSWVMTKDAAATKQQDRIWSKCPMTRRNGMSGR